VSLHFNEAINPFSFPGHFFLTQLTVQNTDATHNPLTERVITHLFWNEHGNSSFLALE
jgi:hypothetical protein